MGHEQLHDSPLGSQLKCGVGRGHWVMMMMMLVFHHHQQTLLEHIHTVM